MSVQYSGDKITFSDGSTVGSGWSGFKNRIINGDMRIDQRNAGASVSSANGFITDRWSLAKYDPTGGSYSGQQVTDAPSGFTNSLKVTVTSSTTQSTDQYWQAFQKIEGFNTADLGFGTSSASQVTLSFWVKSSVTGTYSVSLFNDGVGGSNRAYVTTYVINAANTWEYKTVTIPGDGVAGAGLWGTTNGGGIGVYFDLGCGTNQQATANTWTASNARRVSGTVRLMATGSATWQVTGVQLEKGSTATSFDYRPYGTELSLCQRYFQIYKGSDGVSNNYVRMGYGYFSSSTNALCYITNKVNMRTQPSVTASGSFVIYNGTFYGISAGNVTTDGATTTMVTGLALLGSGYPGAGVFGDFITNASSTATLSISAEL